MSFCEFERSPSELLHRSRLLVCEIFCSSAAARVDLGFRLFNHDTLVAATMDAYESRLRNEMELRFVHRYAGSRRTLFC